MFAVRAAIIVMFVVCCAGSAATAVERGAVQTRQALSPADVDALARLLQMEDTRQFDAAALATLLASPHAEVRRRAVITVGRVVHDQGLALLDQRRNDPVPEIVATVAFAMGQLKNPAAVPWLTETMDRWPANADAAFEAARALGKIRSPDAWAALSAFLRSAPDAPVARVVVGEALLSLGRFTTPEDLTPILRWTANNDVEVRWRAAWALFRPRNPAAVPHLMRLTEDVSPEVRFWAVRGLTPAVEPAAASARLRTLVTDPDRRVRTEAVRTLAAFDDDASVAAVLALVRDPDTWISVSAAEAAPPAPPRGGGTGRAGGQGRGGRAAAPPQPPPGEGRTLADYRAIVERWIVPAYNGAPRPRALWMTAKGEIEIELFAADAPLGMEELVRLTESGAIVGTPFSRVVPNFVAQQATIQGARRLRDEVNSHGLTRANLAWASAGLDTGRPGYTLGNTPQPHNEGDFTSLGRVVRGMDVVDRLELGDTVTAARLQR